MTATQRLRRVVDRFWNLLDSETVRLFVWPYYLALLAWGIYASVWAAPITFVETVMGHTFWNLWVWTQIPGTLSVLIGLILRHGGTPLTQMSTPALFGDYLGLWMQIGGHLCMGLVLLGFEVAAIEGAYWGQATFSIFVVAPFVLGCAFLTLQTTRKLLHAEKLHRENGRVNA